MAINDEELNNETLEEENTTEQVVETPVEAEVAEETVLEEVNQEKTSEKTTKSKKNGNKKPSKIKATFSELKKVTWPSFGSVVKKTGVVLSVTLIFLLIIIGIDQLLFLLYDLLTKNIV